MAKKKNKKVVKAPKTENVKPEVEEVIEEGTTEVQPEIAEETKAETKTEKNKETKKDNKAQTSKKKSKENRPNKLVRKTKETFSELKKVSWPNFKTVCKNTGVVIVVVVLFTIVLFGIDRGLAALYNLIPR